MSDYSTNSTINLTVNGNQVESKLKKLERQMISLREKAQKAAEMGDKGTLQKTQKEISRVEKEMRKVQNATRNVELTLQNLDKATPQQLKKDLKTLKAQLNSIERGSEAWNAHVEKIKILDAELKKVNAELRQSEGFWDRFNRKMNDWQTTLAAAAAALTGLIMAARQAVSAYANMDGELANVRKFTGMTADEVERLNEAFKKMDTRTSREELNKLAEEAGRLGKSSVEDTLGFVRAADKINVALDDLGDGATLTLSKLTNIFGDEERLGTEQALLSVGSVINELSQNCTASAGYLATFAQRMAGVGAQAGLTIPQIMAFGAVLDSQGQAVEMSASAMSKLTMDIFKDTAKVAKAVGIPLKDLNDALAKGTNEGLMLLLTKLHDLGDMQVLAPIFKDMGENGVRASQVIAALAGNIETVKWQQEEANKAFNEATSVTKEYNVQNNTVQAGLDKAKKRVSEMAIELGEKLMPIMRHVISSTTLILKILSTVVSFIYENKTAILTATAAYTGYTIAVNASNIAFKAHYAWLVITQAAHKALNAVLATGKTAWVLLKIAMAKIEGNYARVALLQTEINTAMKANAIGLIVAGLVALSAIIAKVVSRMKEQREAQDALNNTKATAMQNAQEEIDKINTLREAANNETLAMKQRQQAVENLNKIIPGYNAQIDETTGKLKESKQALDDYIASLVHQYEVQGAKEQIQKLSKEIAEKKVEKAEAEERAEAARQAQKNVQQSMVNEDGTPRMQTSGGTAAGSVYAQASTSAEVASREKEVSNLKTQIDNKQKVIDRYKKVYGNDLQESAIAETTTTTTETTTTEDDGTSSNTHEDKFKREKEWKEREEALNTIAYAKGERNFEQYTMRMDQIAMEFYDKQLEHTDLTEQERIVIEGQRAEESIKQKEKFSKKSIEEEKLRYQQEISALKQKYVDSEISQKDYEEAEELAEMKHLQLMTNITEEGSKERADAEKQYMDKMFAQQKKRQEEAEKNEKKLQENLKKYKDMYFGETKTQMLSNYDEQITFLDLAYAAEIKAAGKSDKEKRRIDQAYRKAKIALMKKYNQEELRENQNFLQNFNDDVQNFLKSDLGQSIMGTAQVLIDGMSSIFTQLTSIIQAELQIQENAINSKYEKELSLAEGNNYKVSKIEKQKEEELARVKNEANKKMYNMQVIQAIAQTATGAINAYSSAAAIPLIGWLMAPVAAATAVAAGMLQVAAIRKQQQAAESSGYAEGGYTKKGGKYEPAGIVHAGEWVASQKLLENPQTSAIIQSLDYAQRTNTMGSITPTMVNEDISSNVALARSSASTMQQNSSTIDTTLKKLNERLNEPFVTVNTVTGEKGIQKAQAEYDKLIENKKPKYK